MLNGTYVKSELKKSFFGIHGDIIWSILSNRSNLGGNEIIYGIEGLYRVRK